MATSRHAASLRERTTGITRGITNMDDLIVNLKREAEELEQMKRSGVILESRPSESGPAAEREFFLVSDNREIANKYGLTQST